MGKAAQLAMQAEKPKTQDSYACKMEADMAAAMSEETHHYHQVVFVFHIQPLLLVEDMTWVTLKKHIIIKSFGFKFEYFLFIYHNLLSDH